MGNSLSVPATVWDDHHQIRYPFIQPSLQKSQHYIEQSKGPTSADLPKLLCYWVLLRWSLAIGKRDSISLVNQIRVVPTAVANAWAIPYPYQQQCETTITKYDILSYNLVCKKEKKKKVSTAVLYRTVQHQQIYRSYCAIEPFWGDPWLLERETPYLYYFYLLHHISARVPIVVQYIANAWAIPCPYQQRCETTIAKNDAISFYTT